MANIWYIFGLQIAVLNYTVYSARLQSTSAGRVHIGLVQEPTCQVAKDRGDTTTTQYQLARRRQLVLHPDIINFAEHVARDQLIPRCRCIR